MNKNKLVFATHNAHKTKEIRAAVGDIFEILSLDDLDFHDEIDEPYETLSENARAKSEFIHKKFDINCFGDDTGLEVDALDGRPGVYSARYAGPQCNAQDNMQKLLQEMEGAENRSARFKTVISLFLNGTEHQFEGVVEGEILTEKHGTDGFGYDPIFKPSGFELSFAEMPLHEKNEISHRGRAVQKLVEFLKKS